MARRSLHKCGWPGCDRKVETWQWGCAKHFFKLPNEMRQEISRLKHWWPEAKRARRKATAWAKKHGQE